LWQQFGVFFRQSFSRVKPVAGTTGDAGTRRDFLYVASGAMGAVGVAAVAWPLIDQMNPSAAALALGTSEIDIASIQPGQQVVFKHRGLPLFVRRRTPAEIASANAVDVNSLPDPLARNAALPDNTLATDASRAVKPEWLVLIGVCTHLGCVPIGDGAGEFGGWFCPCHGSHYDTAGRIRKGPAPRNLDVPVAAFEDESTIKLG
jgi:ubiquinol-cytochrome c reductase iron-sulfur subunit